MAQKSRNELKIGILTLITLIVLFLGFNFLKGNSLFDSDYEYITYYDNVEGLNASSKVMQQGFPIGKVESVELQPDRKFKIRLLINEKYIIPEGSVVQLASGDLLSGTKLMTIVLGNSTVRAKDGTVLPNMQANGLMQSLTSNAGPAIESLKHTLSSVDSIAKGVNSILDDNGKKHLNNTIAALDLTMQQLSQLANALGKQSTAIASVMTNLDRTMGNASNFTNTLNKNSYKIDNILTNAETATAQFNNTKIQESLTSLESATKKLNTILQKVDNKDGSLGLLVNDKELYNNLSTTLKSVDELMVDLKKSPSKYINISILGKK